MPAPLSVRYPGAPVAVRFLERPNRYLVRVRPMSGGTERLAHLPNPGRMEELLIPGSTVGWIVPARGVARRTSFDLVAVRHGRTTVSVDSRFANRIVARLLAQEGLPEVGRGPWRAEQPWGGSRFDFGRRRADGTWAALLEVKSSNLRVGRRALFPDAPTVRGLRHVEHLAAAARQGIRASVLFVLQRDDVDSFAPNAALDPEFARGLTGAARAGVRVLAHTLRVRPGGAEWGRNVPVCLPRSPTGLTKGF